MKSATRQHLVSLLDDYRKQQTVKEANVKACHQRLLQAVSDNVFQEATGALGRVNHQASVDYRTAVEPYPWATLSTTSPAGYSSSLTFACEPRGLVWYKSVSGPSPPRGADSSGVLNAGSDIEQKAVEFIQEVLEADVLARLTP